MTRPLLETPTRPSCLQQRILKWIRDTNPNGWVTVSGMQVQQCRSMAPRYLELEGKSGSYQIRLTDEGRVAA